MAQRVQDLPLRIEHGHDGQKIVQVFSQPVKQHSMTIQQARDMIAAIEKSIQMLAEHQNNERAKAAGNG